MREFENEWNELDDAAKVNLGRDGFCRFQDYKKELQRYGHVWANDAYDILAGYIWDEIEEIDDEPLTGLELS